MMATGDSAMQLLVQKLKQRFPEIPDDVVCACAQQYPHDFVRCVQMLSQKSAHYMYGPVSELPINVKPEHNIVSNEANHQIQQTSRYTNYFEGRSGSVSQNRQNGNSSPGGPWFYGPNANLPNAFDPRVMGNTRSSSVSGMSQPVSSTTSYQSSPASLRLPKSAPVMPSKYEPFQSFDGTRSPFFVPSSNPSSQIPLAISPGGVLPPYAQQGMYYDQYKYEMRVSYQAQVSNQRAQMERLHRRLLNDKQKLDLLTMEVANMEKLLSKRVQSTHSILPHEEIQKLKEETNRLRVECDTMSREVDTLGKVPLGETSEDFYKHINRGPSGSVGVPPPRPIRIDPPPPFPSLAQPASSTSDEEGHQWNCSACTFLNNPALDKCEICEMPRIMLAAGYS